MGELPEDLISRHFRQSLATLQQAANDAKFQNTVREIAAQVEKALRQGGKVLVAGNGGSAADAQHLAAELVSRFRFDRDPLPAIALTTDPSVITSIANDYGFEQVFQRQVRALGRNGDVFVGISTSGRSPNVLKALQAARELGLVAIGMTGLAGGDMARLCDICLCAPSDEVSLIQQLHGAAAHAICSVVETAIFAATRPGRSSGK